MTRFLLLLFLLLGYTVYSQEDPFTLPYTFVQEKPMFEQCKDSLKEKQFGCFKEQLDRHIFKYYKYPMAALEMGISGKVKLKFRINTDGSVTVLEVRGIDKLLEKETERVIKTLPPFIPGKHLGNPVAVTFSHIVNFKIEQ